MVAVDSKPYKSRAGGLRDLGILATIVHMTSNSRKATQSSVGTACVTVDSCNSLICLPLFSSFLRPVTVHSVNRFTTSTRTLIIPSKGEGVFINHSLGLHILSAPSKMMASRTQYSEVSRSSSTPCMRHPGHRWLKVGVLPQRSIPTMAGAPLRARAFDGASCRGPWPYFCSVGWGGALTHLATTTAFL